jgi:hypothetical protein
MVEHTKTDMDIMFQCDLVDLLSHLEEINGRGKSIILLIDELNKIGVPLDVETSAFLTKNFLDTEGRYLIFSSHIQFNVDSLWGGPSASLWGGPSASLWGGPSARTVLFAPSGRTIKTLPLPFCTDRTILQNMLDGNNVTDLKITLSVGIPSLLFLMCRPNGIEMTFKERFYDVVRNYLGPRNCHAEQEYIREHRTTLLRGFLSTVVHGARCGGFFEAFSTPVLVPQTVVPANQQLLRFPLPYIPIILQFLGENEGYELYESLRASAESTESGKDWELVIAFSIYIRSLEARYCTPMAGDKSLKGPFEIATNGVEDVKVFTIPDDITTVDAALALIKDTTEEAKTVYIFQLGYAEFPDFDGFVSYRALKRTRDDAPTIHGYQCKLTRGYPAHAVDTRNIARGWFLRGGNTVNTPGRDGWVFPTVDWMQTNLLGFGLRVLHPLEWGSLPNSNGLTDRQQGGMYNICK